MPRTIAIGDIHGCKSALDRLLKEIQPEKDDTIVGIGDYVDRGMDSAGVIETLSELISKCRFVPLIGNHELMMYRALQNGKTDFEFWYQHGGNTTLQSYGGRLENIPASHMMFLNHCIRFFETETHFFIHANYAYDLPLAEQPDELVFWTHIREQAPPMHISGKIAVVGHTPQPDGTIRDCGHVKLIDTYCYGDQWLTALEVNTGEYWQATNWGDFRKGKLDELDADQTGSDTPQPPA
jgi:serine/threonine protein phosphatase 1